MPTLIKQICDVEEQLIFTLEYDEGVSKTRVVSLNDYVSIAYNKNGTRRVVNGTVVQIYANKYAGEVNKKDWYILLANDEVGGANTIRIGVWQVIDIEVIHMHRFEANIHTPNNTMRVTDFRIKGNTLQCSSNCGRSWRNVGILSEGPTDDDFDLTSKIEAIIGSDQYATSNELIAGLVDLVNEEVARRKNFISTTEELSSMRPADTTPYDSSDGPGYWPR